MIIRQLLARTRLIGGQRLAKTVQSSTEAEYSIPRPQIQIRTLARPDHATSDHDVRLWHQEIAQRLGRNDFYLVCEPSCGGFAVSITYRHGQLVKAVATGGDRKGQVITDTVRKLSDVPKRLTGTGPPVHLEVLGNLYVPAPANAEKPDSRHSALRLLAHGILSSAGGRVPANQWAALAYLRAVGFDVSAEIKLARTLQDVLSHHQALAQNAKGTGYPCRGMIVKVNRFDHQSLLASGEDGAAWALSYAFPGGPTSNNRQRDMPSALPRPTKPQPVLQKPAKQQPLEGRSVAVEIRSG